MGAITFDTHRFVDTLHESDFSERQAAGVSKAYRASLDQMNLATKGDIDGLRTELMTEMRLMKYQLMAWFGGVQVMTIIAIAALIKLL